MQIKPLAELLPGNRMPVLEDLLCCPSQARASYASCWACSRR